MIPNHYVNLLKAISALLVLTLLYKCVEHVVKGFLPNLDSKYKEWSLSLNRYNIGFKLMYALWIKR